MTGVERVGLVGCGAMGTGFAEICARAGLDVRVALSTQDGVGRGRQRLARAFERLVHKGRITGAERDEALARVSFTADIGDLADRQFVLESIVERLPDKVHVFALLDKVVAAPDAILASNTSSIPIMKLGQATGDPGRVVGLHFFNPVPVMPLAELTSSLRTTGDTRDRTRAFVTEVLGKRVIEARDRPGFIVNALLVPYLLSAVRMVEAGLASAEEVDLGMTLGCGHPKGPLALIDMIGLDVIASVGAAMYEEWKEPLHAPPALLSRMIEAGFLGRKSGRGFYAYE